MQVRVENLYYLLCYAWRCLDARDIVPVHASAGPAPEALFARVLNVAVQRLIRHRLDRGYQEESEDLRRPRGKPRIGETLSRGLLERGMVRCDFDELTEDVLHNRIIKATLRRLALVDTLDDEHRRDLGQLVRSLAHVTDLTVTSNDFRRVQVQGNRNRYRFVLNVCHLVHRCVLLDERVGRWRFRSFTGTEQAMGRLFQEFLREFLRTEQRVFPDVRSPQVPWDLDGDDGGLLPTMNTDIVLRSPGHTMVVEAKCYASPLVSRFGGGGALHAEHVYQLFAYVSNLAVKEATPVSGMLVYAVDRDLLPPTSFKLLGHEIRVLGVNLNRPWQRIHSELLDAFRGAPSCAAEHASQ